MSQSSRPRANGPEQRRSRNARLEPVTVLEERKVLAPFVSVYPTVATFTAQTPEPAGEEVGTVVVSGGDVAPTSTPSQSGAFETLPAFPEAAAITSVSELTPTSSFGGDIVRIRTGPGGDFGNEIYAISRGAGDNAATGAINRPGVIYRVDPATGKSSVFFDLNTVIPQLDPTQTSAANNAGDQTGLVNWYDITFDPEGVFDGKPSMFVSSVDSADPAKNAIYRIAPDGTFMGAFTTFSDNSLNSAKLTFNPSAILIPPVEQQTYLRGLLAGTGTGAVTGISDGTTTGATSTTSTGADFAALFFDSTSFRPGTPISSLALQTGVRQTGLDLGPQTSLTSANGTYSSLVYSTFADFGTPAFGTNLFSAEPGLSGVQGYNSELLINSGLDPNIPTPTVPNPNIDLYPVISTDFRRFEDSAFDQYGYFSQGLPLTGATGTGTGAGTGTGTTGSGGTGTGGGNSTSLVGSVGAPVFAGSLFVADLATGLSVDVTPPTPTGGTAQNPILIPVQGDGEAGVTAVSATGGDTVEAPAGNIGGRIVRIDQFGRVTDFAQGFATSGAYDSSSFANSSLSLSFSSDGTTLYVADDDAIWQFKTTASLAGSASGSIIGLNDLRTLGVPYDGNNSAVDVVDTGVDAKNPSFRGRVAPGTNTAIPGGLGNDDFSSGLSGIGSSGGTSSGSGGTAGTGGTGGSTGTGTGSGTGTGTTGSGTNTIGLTQNGHGTPVAGVIAQFVPQATINPIDVFEPFTATSGGQGSVSFATNQATTTDDVFAGLQYVANTPYVQDPVRPQDNDRVIATSLAFGTSQTFETEQSAYKQYPQVVITFKNQLDKLLQVGIAPIAAAGQFGSPIGANSTIANVSAGATNNAQNTSVGDVNGMSFPAILNEVISVTGTYPFIFQDNASTPPTDPEQTIIGRFSGPILLFGNTVNGVGSEPDSTTNTGTTTTGSGTGSNTTGGSTATTGTGNSLAQLTAAEGGGATSTTGGTAGGSGAILTYSDRILGSVNRNATTDFAAPALDAPTFRRTFGSIDNFDPNTFEEGGTSISSAIVTGSYALVSSALDYWNQIRTEGTTSSAYLTTPVGALSLDYAPNSLYNLQAYNNPNGINAILAYTAVPATDVNDNLTLAGPPKLLGRTTYRSFARVDVGNAIAAVEGKVALDYLIKHNTFNIIDTNHNGLITSQEIQNFVNNSNAMGLPEAGAMARLLGGTARAAINNTETLTDAGEQPDEPDVLQRRFNFFDYAVHGKLQGSISIPQLKELDKYILPAPSAFTITDRQRASVNGFLIAPAAQRNFKDLQHLDRGYEFVPKSVYKKYNGLSPAQFGVNQNDKGTSTAGPVFTLFDGKSGGGSTAATATTTTSTAAAATSTAATTTSTTAASTATGTTSTTAAAATNLPNMPLEATNTLQTYSGNFAPAAGTTTATATTPAAATAPATPTTTAPVATPTPTATTLTTTTTPVTTAPATTTVGQVTTPTASQASLAQQVAALVAQATPAGTTTPDPTAGSAAAPAAKTSTRTVVTGKATPKAPTVAVGKG